MITLHILFLIGVFVFFIMGSQSKTHAEYMKYTFWEAVFCLGVFIIGLFINSGMTLIGVVLLVLTILMFIQSRSYIPRLWEWIQWHTWYKLLSERPSKFDKYDKNK